MKILSPEEEQVERLGSLLPGVRRRAARAIDTDPERYADQLVQALEMDEAVSRRAQWWNLLVGTAIVVSVVAVGGTVGGALRQFGDWLTGDPTSSPLQFLVNQAVIFPWLCWGIYLAARRRMRARRRYRAVRTLAAILDQRVFGFAMEQVAFTGRRKQGRIREGSSELYKMLLELLDARTRLPEPPPLSKSETKSVYRCLRSSGQPLVAAVIRYLAAHGDESALRELARQADRTDEEGSTEELRSLAREAIKRIQARFQGRTARETLPRPAGLDGALLHPASPAHVASELLSPAAGPLGEPAQPAAQALAEQRNA